MKEVDAQAGTAVVIDNKTGDVLALANYPTFDPNKLNQISPENLPNGAIQNIYSPGSVFKLVTYGSALDKGLITPEGEIDSGNGTIEIARHKFTDSHAIRARVLYESVRSLRAMFVRSRQACASVRKPSTATSRNSDSASRPG